MSQPFRPPIHFPFMDLSKSPVPPDSFPAALHRSGILLGECTLFAAFHFMPIYTVDGQTERKTTNADSRASGMWGLLFVFVIWLSHCYPSYL